MVNAQEWLDENYPKNGVCKIENESYQVNNFGKKRKQIRELDIYSKNLESHLDLRNFINLEELNFFDNQISSLDLSKNTKLTFLNCSWNLLTDIGFLRRVPCPEKLTSLISNSSFLR